MSRIKDWLQLIDNPDQPPLTPAAGDGPLLSLLVHVAFSDGEVADDERALLARVRPDLEPADVVSWVLEAVGKPMDWSGLRAMATTVPERMDVLRFATRMACMDGIVTEAERVILDEVSTELALEPDAADGCIDEVVAVGGSVEEQRVFHALRSMLWDELIPSRGELEGPMAAVVPDDADPICIMEHEDDEVGGLFREGICLPFASGPRYVSWPEIVGYTRLPVPGSSMHLRLGDGAILSVPDPRLKDIGKLLDLIYGRADLAQR